jgi:hypothetical protein
LGINISQRPVSFENITLSCLENLEKYFRLQIAQQGGQFFHSGISVPLFKVLYA